MMHTTQEFNEESPLIPKVEGQEEVIILEGTNNQDEIIVVEGPNDGINFFDRKIFDTKNKVFCGLPPELFNHISSFLPLEPASPENQKKTDFRASPLSALSIASPEMKNKVDETEKGEILKELNQLQNPPSIEAYFATPYGYPTFVRNTALVGGAAGFITGVVVGGILLGPFGLVISFGTAYCSYYISGAIAAAVGGYMIDGFRGAYTGLTNFDFAFVHKMMMIDLEMIGEQIGYVAGATMNEFRQNGGFNLFGIYQTLSTIPDKVAFISNAADPIIKMAYAKNNIFAEKISARNQETKAKINEVEGKLMGRSPSPSGQEI